MPELVNKTILIISPQEWGKMFVSKHHYAIGLAGRGNRVFFLNPPAQDNIRLKDAVLITPSGIENLWMINHSLYFPYRIKFHALPLFHVLMRAQVGRILRKIGHPVDVIWSFDIGNLYPLDLFGRAPKKIFHPVDEPLNPAAIHAAKGADVIFSVTREILKKYEHFPIPGYLINHGVSEEFFLPVDINRANGEPVRVGFAGNLLRTDIDRDTVLQIVSKNKNVVFECWGAFNAGQSNMGGTLNAGTKDFIDTLSSQPNVTLHGAVPAHQLATAIHRMDAFLICYDIKRDQSKGTNYHKIMEFLSTGKVIVSNNVSAYKDHPELVQMPASREDNKEMPDLFRKVINNLDKYNSPASQSVRFTMARNNSYAKQIDRIEKILSGSTGASKRRSTHAI